MDVPVKVLDAKDKQNVQYCIPLELRDENIKINLTKVKRRVEPSTELINEPIAIVSFGPSLNDTWQEIKKFKYVMTCSGAHKFLVEKGIIPTYQVDLDPRLHKLKILGQPQKETQYLIASTIHPQYLDALEGHDVKLWHIFANEGDGARVLPRGEWSITGGSSVGLRCLTLARFLGYTNMHIFGMDGSFKDGKTHTTDHPNPPKENYETEYEGKKYLTTPSILHVAKETFHELDQMPDCKFTFYGEGLVQEMAKKYVQSTGHKAPIAFNKPELISQEYIELNAKLHRDNPGYGMGGAKHKDTVIKLSRELKTTSILDYGAGKMQLAKSLDFPIWNYDPAVREISQSPSPADIVVCTDCLEHIEPDRLKFVLDDLRYCVKQVGYFVISTRKAAKTYANNKNTHLIVKGKEWWTKKLSQFFDIGTIIEKEKECELHIVVAPKKIVSPDTVVVERDGLKFMFYTPNETTKWRANTLFTKEPSTVEWINSMKAGEILYDIGANVGSYSVLAGVKGVKVYAFEPEAENYSLLVKNLALNGIEPNAYCLAASDEEKAGTLYAGSQGAGGACHSFNEKIGFDLQLRETKFSQGCMGIPLDTLVERGLPSPHHLKIDVDGLEYKVVQGAGNILMNGLKSLLVEVNPSLPQHREMVDRLISLGFSYDSDQVERATRKDGTFKGCAEYVFRKQSETEIHLKKKIEDAEMIIEPFPYLVIRNILPQSVYDKLVNNMPDNYVEIEKSRGTKGYPERFTAVLDDKMWKELGSDLTTGVLKKALLTKFGISGSGFKEDVLLIRDNKTYSIPPHTDSLNKVISALFYFPKRELEGAGTNIYEPIEKGFECKTGKHYNFQDFTKVNAISFKPNTLLVFARTDNSFHGVEPTDTVRDVLLYNINK